MAETSSARPQEFANKAATDKTSAEWQILIKNALLFDGTGSTPVQHDVAINNGVIAAVGPDLPIEKAARLVDANGQWLSPGLWDIHTHLDLEVELDPGLTEVVRHGTTTAVVANCSIGVAFGRQNKDGHEPIVSCFARVENVPKPVLRKVAEKIDWDTPQGYLEHFKQIPLGANVVPLLPHSMLRIEVMGLENCITREPTETELGKMETLLDAAMESGYVGFSTDALPFHYLSDDPHRQIKIPTHAASYGELKRLTNVVRKRERVWQATPPKDSPLQVFKTFLLTSGRLFGKPLKVTAVAALDVVTNRNLARMGNLMTRILNSKLVRGDFHLQALAAPFKVYADGLITPLAEEIPAMRELNEIDLDRADQRQALMSDPAFIERFRKTWYYDKKGFSLARIKRALGVMDDSLSRDLADMIMTERPLPVWENQSLQAIYERLQRWQKSGAGALNEEEAAVFAELPKPIGDDCNFLLALLRKYDTKLRWHAMVANDDVERMEKILFEPLIQPGFNDSGAHITNMAYFDGNLRGLQLAQRRGLDKVAYHINRLTQKPAEFFGVQGVGRIAVGQRADVILIDPDALRDYDSEANTQLHYREVMGHEQLLNRSEGVVTHSWIAGIPAWENSAASKQLGETTMGVAVTAGDIRQSAAAQSGSEVTRAA